MEFYSTGVSDVERFDPGRAQLARTSIRLRRISVFLPPASWGYLWEDVL